VELALYTDSVPDATLREALDLAAEIGAGSVELATGGQSSAPHLGLSELLGSAAARVTLTAELAERGLRIAALNCSAWPMHPRVGEQHVEVIRRTLQLAGELGVEKVVTMSGCPGDAPAAPTINWITYPWPPDAVELLAAQWERAVALWHDLAAEAAASGVRQIALELHPLHLAYNAPTLLRLRGAVGPVVGANIDPSHLFWQQIDPLRTVRELGDAVHHVHLKDVEVHENELALAGVLDSTPFADHTRRAWTFCTVGRGHDAVFWGAFLDTLRDAGYDDVLSIENEDPVQLAAEGVREAAAFVAPLLPADRQVAT
jgi:sugar phosphate isomerase/epimerase